MSRLPSLKLELRGSGRIRPSLDGLRRTLEELGNPERRFRSMLVVGTNGKGSTAAIAETVLRHHGVRTGLYTSPHLVRVEERIRVDGTCVERGLLESHLTRLDAHPDLTYFEALTAAAFGVFADAGVEVAVLEAGMGGSWDATRLAGSAIAGLTNVGTDHRAWLGDDRRTIARDKGAALAAAERAVVGSGLDAALRAELRASHAVAAASLLQCRAVGPVRAEVAVDGQRLEITVPLPGRHQLANLELAVALCMQAAAAGWSRPLDWPLVRRAIEGVSWPGRLSRHLVAGREVVMDCAHNLEAASALADHLAHSDERFNLLFSCLDDKPAAAMAKLIEPRVGQVVVCGLSDERSADVRRLGAAFADADTASDPLTGLARLPDPVLATGSIRLVGELLAASGWEPPW